METPKQIPVLFPLQQKLIDDIQKAKCEAITIPVGYGKAYILLHYALQHPDEKIIIALPYIESVQMSKLFIEHEVKNVVIVVST